MVAKPFFKLPDWQRGSSMIEVLVTLVIVSFGLLGLAGLQTRLQSSEMESYQRTQALLLLNDMANRIATNRLNAVSYVTTAVDPLGAGMVCTPIDPADPTVTQGDRDLSEWCNALQGAAEVTDGSSVGAMIGGRGCVEDLGGGQYFITVAWQGLTPLSAPAAAVACGQNSYDTAGSSCVNDRCRRVVTTTVRIATLL